MDDMQRLNQCFYVFIKNKSILMIFTVVQFRVGRGNEKDFSTFVRGNYGYKSLKYVDLLLKVKSFPLTLAQREVADYSDFCTFLKKLLGNQLTIFEA